MVKTWTVGYWPIPFRGNFVKVILEYAGEEYDVMETSEVIQLKTAAVSAQPVPFIGPPFLLHNESGFAISQTAAIVEYLVRKFGFVPESPELAALAQKAVLDCIDVLVEITRHNGNQMWTRDAWSEFRGPGKRLDQCLGVLEELAKRHGLKEEHSTGFFLGTEKMSAADFAVYALFEQLARCMPPLIHDLQRAAPRVWKMCQRIGENPKLQAFSNAQSQRWGRSFCSGQIEASIFSMIEQDEKAS